MLETTAKLYGKWIKDLTAAAERFDAIDKNTPRGNTDARGRATQFRYLVARYKRLLIEEGMDEYIPRYGIEKQLTQGELTRTMQGD